MFRELNLKKISCRDVITPKNQNIHIGKRLTQIWRCSENYKFISKDLVNHCQVGSIRNKLALLLNYYLHGLRRAADSVPKNAEYLEVQRDIKDSLDTIYMNLFVSGIELSVFPEEDGEKFKIPNASILELLIKSRFENIEISQPYTLSEPALLHIAGI